MIDEYSETWKTVKAWAEKRLGMARSILESPNTDDRETQLQRGAIIALKELSGLVAQQKRDRSRTPMVKHDD